MSLCSVNFIRSDWLLFDAKSALY